MYECRVINGANDQTLGSLTLSERRHMDVSAFFKSVIPAMLTRSAVALCYAGGAAVISMVGLVFFMPIMLFIFDFSAFVDHHAELKALAAALFQVGVTLTPEQTDILGTISSLLYELWFVMLTIAFMFKFCSNANLAHFSNQFLEGKHRYLCRKDNVYQEASRGNIRFEDTLADLRGTDAGKLVAEKQEQVFKYAVLLPTVAAGVPIITYNLLSDMLGVTNWLTVTVMFTVTIVSWLIGVKIALRLERAWTDYSSAVENHGQQIEQADVVAG